MRDQLPLDVFVTNVARRRALTAMLRGAVKYFTDHPEGRALHDRLDLMTALTPVERDRIQGDLRRPFRANETYKNGASLRLLESGE